MLQIEEYKVMTSKYQTTFQKEDTHQPIDPFRLRKQN